jgi:hypothetical protein
MVSLRFRNGSRSGAALTAAALVTAFCAGEPARGNEHGAASPERSAEQVEQILAEHGALSMELLEPLMGLAVRLRESDDHVAALVVLERAMQVLRVNRGLHTLEQVPLLTLELGIEEARGNDAAVWALEQELLSLARRHPADGRAAAVFARIADRQMRTLDRYIAGEKPAGLFYGCFYKQWPNSPEGSCTAGSRKIVVQGMLAEAQRNYSAAIGALLQSGVYDGELKELEMKLLRGVDLVRSLYFNNASVQPVPMVPSYVGASRIEPWRSRIAPVAALASWELPGPGGADGGEPDASLGPREHAQMMSPYYRGWQSLRRLYMYSAASSSPTLEQVDALLQIADWELLYSHNGQALAGYESARELLEGAAVPEQEIESLFAPPTPVVLPAFRPNPLAPQEARPAAGHIDVRFQITKYGRGRAVEIVSEANATERDVAHLVRTIKRSRFRPRFAEGGFAEATPVVVRYYLYGGDE